MDLEEIKALVQNVNFSRADFVDLLMESIGSENLEAVRFLIKVDSNINFEVIYGDGTPLSYAVLKENIPIVLELIEAGADPNYELRWDENYMPLYVAASIGNLDIVKLLIQAGADVNCVYYGNYALSVAAISGHKEVYEYLYPLTNDELREGTEEDLLLAIRAKYIEELADPDIIILNKAIYDDDLFIFRKIIDSEVNINAHDSYGNTPLIEACIKANPIIVRELLNAGANPNIRNYDNETPLMRVVGESPYRLEVCRELVQAGTDINAQDNDGRTALMNAANIGSPSSVKLLLDMGASRSIQDNDGKIALDYAYLHSHKDYSWVTNRDYPAVIDTLEQ
jgi:uncharacterized protein